MQITILMNYLALFDINKKKPKDNINVNNSQKCDPALTISNICVVFGDFIQADVALLLLGRVGVGCSWWQSDDEGLCEFDGVSADSIVIRIQQCQDIPFHLSYHIPACLLPVCDTLSAHQPLVDPIKLVSDTYKY